jgi:3-isopropylmalate/(R)-2-methylmalate dehydratase small subunit
MEAFRVLRALAAPYPKSDVDTDRIIRIERCARTPREEMGRWAFEVERFRADGSPDPAFVMNQPAFAGARIFVAGSNFGCGSSREMAVWALQGMGIRCVIAPSFGEIFRGNCLQNGVLPVQLPREAVEVLLTRLADAHDVDGRTLEVDLHACVLRTPWGQSHSFAIEPLRRAALLEGLDEIGLTLKRSDDIARFEVWQREARPWIHAVKGNIE